MDTRDEPNAFIFMNEEPRPLGLRATLPDLRVSIRFVRGQAQGQRNFRTLRLTHSSARPEHWLGYLVAADPISAGVSPWGGCTAASKRLQSLQPWAY